MNACLAILPFAVLAGFLAWLGVGQMEERSGLGWTLVVVAIIMALCMSYSSEKKEKE